MQINDITSYLYTNEASGLLTKTISATDTSQKSGNNVSKTSDFSTLLSEEIKNLTEFNELASVIDGSVLGSISDVSALKSLSEDLMSTGSGREVLSKLAEGHLNSIVLDDSTDSDDSKSFPTTLTSSYTQAVTNTASMQSTLESIMETLNTSSKE